MDPVKKFRQMLTNKEVIVAPGVYDCVLAKVAEKIGLQAVYMGGFGVAGSLVGKPDLGLITGSEMIDHARRITSAVDIPVFGQYNGHQAYHDWHLARKYTTPEPEAVVGTEQAL